MAVGRPVAPDIPFDVPLLAAYAGLRALPWIALAHTDVAPLLILHDGMIETRVLRRRRRAYAEVAEVVVAVRRRTVLVLHLRGSPLTFGAVLRDPGDAPAARAWIAARTGALAGDRN